MERRQNNINSDRTLKTDPPLSRTSTQIRTRASARHSSLLIIWRCQANHARTPPHNPHPTDSTTAPRRTEKKIYNEHPSSRRGGDNFDGVLTKISAISACARRRVASHRRSSAALRTVFECATDLVIDTNFSGFRPAVMSGALVASVPSIHRFV